MAEKSKRKDENLNLIRSFLDRLKVHSINTETSKIYANVYAEIINKLGPKEEKKRRKCKIEKLGISQNDLWIACSAIQHNLIIVSEDSDFTLINKAVPLKVECWKTKILNPVISVLPERKI